MIKVVLFALAVVALVWMLLGGRSRATKKDPGSGAQRPRASEGMVACAHCGVHLPQSEALRVGTQAYCCAAHRDAGPRAAS